MKTYLALYLGATKLLIGEVNTGGEILHSKRYETGYMNQTMALSIIKRFLENYITTEGWINSGRPAVMGLGLTGQVDSEKGRWMGNDSKHIVSIPLSEKLATTYDMPCYIDNGINGAVRAVQLWGHGRDLKDFIYINIGEYIAVRFVKEGKLIRGNYLDEVEFGHQFAGTKIEIKQSYVGKDCISSIAGDEGFDRSARSLKNIYPTNLYIPDNEDIRVDVKEVIFLSQQGDKLCVNLINNAVEAITELIVDLYQNNSPEKIILGGSQLSNDFLYARIHEKLEKKNVNRFLKKNVLLTKFKPDYIGLVGAAAIAINE